jgi:hypothetical protein
MDQCKIVKQFNGNAHVPGIVTNGIEQLIPHQAGHRSDPFATQL